MTGGAVVPCPGTTTTQGTVTVSMPYWRSLSTVRAAVDAVLGQTHPDLRLYLINDGDHITPPWPVLQDIRDPRLIRVELGENRGRYFCDAAVLAATDTPWFAIHDTDDVASPDWLETLLDACTVHGWVAAFGPQTILQDGRETRVEPVLRPLVPLVRLRHLAHHAGVYNTGILRHVGGPHPGYRIGYDTLMVNLVAMAGQIGAVDRPLYTRTIRPNSLTTAPLTRLGSRQRREVRRLLERQWADTLARGPGVAYRATLTADLITAVTRASITINNAEA